MTKIVVNRSYAGGDISVAAKERFLEKKGWSYSRFGEENFEVEGVALDEDGDPGFFGLNNVRRDDPDLIATVEELGEDASGRFSIIEIIEIPEGVEWQIESYDSFEWVAEKHRAWGRQQ